MKLNEEKDRLKYLLKDTITLLCKNGLSHKGSFTVEALIGITLDENNVVLLNINETIKPHVSNELHEEKPENCVPGESESCSDVESPADNESYSERGFSSPKKSRKRHADANDKNTGASPTKMVCSLPEPEENFMDEESENVLIKQEPEDDLQFIKREDVLEEPTENLVKAPVLTTLPSNNVQQLSVPAIVAWPESGPPPNLSFAAGVSQHVLATVECNNLYSGGSISGTDPNVQNENMLQSPPGSSQNTPKSKKKSKAHRRLTANSLTTCTICQQVFASSTNLEGHMIMKHSIGDPITCVCGRQFPYRTNYYAHRKHCIPYLSDKIENFEGLEKVEHKETIETA